MALEWVVITTGIFVIEYFYSTIFITITISNPIISKSDPYFSLKFSHLISCLSHCPNSVKNSFIGIVFSLRYPLKPQIFVIWMLSSWLFHTLSYIIYITRPITSHPNVIRRFIRWLLPEKIWKFILWRGIYRVMEKYAVFNHLLHMIGMLSFWLIFGIYVQPALREEFNENYSTVEKFAKYSFISSILLGLDIFTMEILIILFIIPILPIAALVYLFACWCPEIRVTMNERILEDNESDASDNSEVEFITQFRKGLSWQQLLLYIYKYNQIKFRKSNFREHFDEEEVEKSLSPEKWDNESFFEMEEFKNGRERNISFLTNDQTRKNSEMNLVDEDHSHSISPDTSVTPVRIYDDGVKEFIAEIQEEFNLEDEEVFLL